MKSTKVKLINQKSIVNFQNVRAFVILLLFLYKILECSESFDPFELEDAIIRSVISIYRQIPVPIRDMQTKPIEASRIKLYIFSGNHSEIPLIKKLTDPIVCSALPTFFITHGWLDKGEAQLWQKLKDALLRKYHHSTVAIVDWSTYANQGYFVAARDVKVIGRILGRFVVNLHKTCSIPLEKMVLIGHSLGAHLFGFSGKKVKKLTKKKISRIIALDVAGPEFFTKPESGRLSNRDAHFVEAIHTSVETFGFKNFSGMVNFYPNGGNAQPGCLMTFLYNPLHFSSNVACSHLRSAAYLTEALLNPEKFRARKCDSWTSYVCQPDTCGEEFVWLGDLETTKTGNFYFNTTGTPPYY